MIFTKIIVNYVVILFLKDKISKFYEAPTLIFTTTVVLDCTHHL